MIKMTKHNIQCSITYLDIGLDRPIAYRPQMTTFKKTGKKWFSIT